MKRMGGGFCGGFLRLQGLALTGALALGPWLLRAQESSAIDLNKTSDLTNKSFDARTIDFDKESGLAKAAPGFDKEWEFKTGGSASGLIDRTANLGGRPIYAPILDFDKPYKTNANASPLFQGTSPFSEKVSTLATNKTSPFAAETQAAGFDRTMTDKPYRGPESSLLREAMDSLDAASAQMLARHEKTERDPAAPRTDLGGPQQLAVAPMISIDDVKMLIDKDVTPASEAAAPAQAPAPPPAQATH